VPWRIVDRVAAMLEVAARLRGGAEPVLTRYGAGVLAFSQTLDLSAVRRDLGYAPRIAIDDGIDRHAAWWRARR
jgi:nucleoside-diphosphate-sugar epimerase